MKAGIQRKSGSRSNRSANLLKPSGRGILFMTIGMDELHYNEKGNVLTLVKYRISPDE